MEKPKNIFNDVANLGQKYELSTNRFMKLIGEKAVGEEVTREAIMKEMVGADYDSMDTGQRNTMFTMLFEPDLSTAVEMGILEEIIPKISYKRTGVKLSEAGFTLGGLPEEKI
jgi:hypothetical protein